MTLKAKEDVQCDINLVISSREIPLMNCYLLLRTHEFNVITAYNDRLKYHQTIKSRFLLNIAFLCRAKNEIQCNMKIKTKFIDM